MNEKVLFRLFQMPCCHILICWVNHRLPNYCPECGTRVYHKLKHEVTPLITDENAWLRTKDDGSDNKVRREVAQNKGKDVGGV